MITIILSKYSQDDIETIAKIFGYAKIDKHELSFVDVGNFDSLPRDLIFFSIDKEATRSLVRRLISEGVLDKSTFVGNDMINKDSKFLFFNVSLSIVDIMTSQDNKDFMWDKVQKFVSSYREMVPFDDSIEAIDVAPSAASIAPVEEPVSDGIAEYVAEDVKELPSVDGATDLDKLPDVTHNFPLLLQSLTSMVNMSDPGLEKSLAKYQKFILTTPSGEVSVYPTSRIPKEDTGCFISFKDLILLLRFAESMDTHKITFQKIQG